MKASMLGVVALSATAMAGAQTAPTTVKDADLPGLTTPTTLAANKTAVGLQVHTFGGSDNQLRIGASVAVGLGNNVQAQIGGTFARFDTFNLTGGGTVGYGGSEGNFLLKYGLTGDFPASVQFGVSYLDTPAQERRTAAVGGISVGYSLGGGVRVYANPKAIIFQSNTLAGISLGAVVDVAPGYSVFGDWTPLVHGNNAVSTFDGSANRQSLYAVGIRFTKLFSGVSLDLAYTNMIGDTAGFSLTPSLGNTGGLYVGLSYGF